jgi:hypothetical protein
MCWVYPLPLLGPTTGSARYLCSRPNAMFCLHQASIKLGHPVQASTKKLARQLAAAAILESLLESLPLEAFLSPTFDTGDGTSSREEASTSAAVKLAVLFGVDRIPAGAVDPVAGLAAFPNCCQLLQLARDGGVQLLCTPAMLLHNYTQRVRAAVVRGCTSLQACCVSRHHPCHRFRAYTARTGDTAFLLLCPSRLQGYSFHCAAARCLFRISRV